MPSLPMTPLTYPRLVLPILLLGALLALVLTDAARSQTPVPKHRVDGAFRAEHQPGVGSGIGGGSENVTFVIRNSTSEPDDALFQILSEDSSKVLFQVDDDGHIFMPHINSNTDRLSQVLFVRNGILFVYNSLRGYMENIASYGTDVDLLLNSELKTWNGIGDLADERGSGYIAEELDALGLTDLVVYNGEGLPEGIAHVLLPVFLTPILQHHHALLTEREAQLAEREAEVATLQRILLRLQAQLSDLEATYITQR